MNIQVLYEEQFVNKNLAEYIDLKATQEYGDTNKKIDGQ